MTLTVDNEIKFLKTMVVIDCAFIAVLFVAGCFRWSGDSVTARALVAIANIGTFIILYFALMNLVRLSYGVK